VLLRLLKTINGKILLTYLTISKLFSLKHRQDSNNFYREFIACGGDFGDYLKRKKKLEEYFPLIEKLVLQFPFLSISELYRIFNKEHPEYKISKTTFRNYIRQIDTVKYKKAVEKYTDQSKGSINNKILLKELITQDAISDIAKEVIAEHFNIKEEIESEQEEEKKKEVNFFKNFNSYGLSLLIAFLLACGLNYYVIAILFGISKSTVHNKFHSLPNLGNLISRFITIKPRVVSIDEKWIKIKGKWHYVLSIVDNITGFPLYVKLFPSITAESWMVFMRGFKAIYGNPQKIVSDGSSSLSKARATVFSDVPYQLCKFHKLKNLNRKIYENVYDAKLRRKLLKLAKNIFRNRSVSSRKRTALTIVEMDIPKVSDYVQKNILGEWEHLTESLTSNASERFNRKIEKVISKRYGLKSVKFVTALLNALWMKEAFFNKKLLPNSFITKVDFHKLCQENLKIDNLMSFLKEKLIIPYEKKRANK